jgi:hypothetical protein
VLVNVTDLHPRYARHFLERTQHEETPLAGHA